MKDTEGVCQKEGTVDTYSILEDTKDAAKTLSFICVLQKTLDSLEHNTYHKY